MIVIKIKDSVVVEPANSVDSFRREFHTNGQSYTISARELKTLPDDVATLWLAADTDLEEVSRT